MSLMRLLQTDGYSPCMLVLGFKDLVSLENEICALKNRFPDISPATVAGIFRGKMVCYANHKQLSRN